MATSHVLVVRPLYGHRDVGMRASPGPIPPARGKVSPRLRATTCSKARCIFVRKHSRHLPIAINALHKHKSNAMCERHVNHTSEPGCEQANQAVCKQTTAWGSLQTAYVVGDFFVCPPHRSKQNKNDCTVFYTHDPPLDVFSPLHSVSRHPGFVESSGHNSPVPVLREPSTAEQNNTAACRSERKYRRM